MWLRKLQVEKVFGASCAVGTFWRECRRENSLAGENVWLGHRSLTLNRKGNLCNQFQSICNLIVCSARFCCSFIATAASIGLQQKSINSVKHMLLLSVWA